MWTLPPSQNMGKTEFLWKNSLDMNNMGSSRLAEDHGVEVAVEKFYRMMDRLDERRVGLLQRIVFNEVMGLLGGKIEVVFFDVTTLSFASEVEDSLRLKGWSKDGKPQRVQVVLALLQNGEGLPIGYELFPGNTADVSTLEPVLERFLTVRRPWRKPASGLRKG